MLFLAGATFSTAVAGKKDKKKKVQADTVAVSAKPVSLITYPGACGSEPRSNRG